MTRRVGRWSMEVRGVEAGEVIYSLTCLECGGFEQRRRGDGSNMDMVYCAACSAWLGRLTALNVKAAMRAKEEGHEIDVRRYLAPDMRARLERHDEEMRRYKAEREG